MKWLMSLLAATMLMCTVAGCSKVPAGTVGVMVDLYGSDKGVQTQVMTPGRYWVGYNQELYIFPTFTQTYTWTNSVHEGKAVDESIQFQSSEGMVVAANVGITYHVMPDKVPLLFQKYREGLDEVTDKYLRNMVRDSFVQESSKLPIETIYGKGKSDLVDAVQKDVSAQVAAIGIVIEKIYIVGGLGLPDAIVQSINAKAGAVQKAEQRNNEVAQTQAEAQKAIAEAQGLAQSKLIVADAEAKAIKLKSDALRDSPMLVQWEAVAKWDGQLPQVSGGSMPFLNLGNLAAKTQKEAAQ